MKLQKGFSLIELMIVVVVIGILVTLGIPAYQDYVIRGKIPDATSALANKRVQMEQFFQDNHTYLNAPACNNDTTTSKYYTFSCPTLTATTYTIQAAGGNADQSMAAFTYTIDQSNSRQTTALPADWGATPASCWVTKKGGGC